MKKSRDLKTINTAEENILQIQVLPGLSATLPSKMTREEILTSNVIYESAHGILNKGMNEASARVLVFLRLSLIAAASWPARECAARARELLRCSGCLQDMLDMFLSTKKITKENWKVLCECLTESCRDCRDNQLYCSSLISTCIQRRDEMNNDCLKLLYCLLLNNTSNINLFVECNGTSIFTEDTIHDSSRMELLSVVVKNASAANLLKRDSDLLKALITVGEDYKVNCQGSWKMVEWASEILFHLASHIEGVDNSIRTTINRSDFDVDMNMSEKTLDSVSVPFLLKPNWDKDKFSNIFKNATIQHKVNDYESKCSMTEIEGFRKPFSEGHIGFSSSTIDFAPKFVSTPKRKITTPRGMLVAGLREELLNRTEQKTNNVSQREPCEKNTATLIKNTLSKSARLLNIVHNSCVSMYRALGIIFCPKPADTKSRSLWKKKFKIDEKTMNKFTKYLKQSITHPDTKVSDHLKVQKQVKRKLAIKQKIRKSIVKQLKNGMHLYGCNFKKIAQAMWPHEKEMTPKVLYHIYRKYILK